MTPKNPLLTVLPRLWPTQYLINEFKSEGSVAGNKRYVQRYLGKIQGAFFL